MFIPLNNIYMRKDVITLMELPEVIYAKNLIKILYDKKLITHKEYINTIDGIEKRLAKMLNLV